MRIDASDISDVGFVSEAELISSGAANYRSESIVDIVSGTLSFAANTTLINYDDPIQAGDTVVITGNAAAGTYVVSATNLDLASFEVVGAIADAVGGTANFRYPPGATRVGVDPTSLSFTSETNLQAALEDITITGGNDLAWRRHFLLMGG